MLTHRRPPRMAAEPPRARDSDSGHVPGGRRHATLLALGSATVLSIYSAGFLRTRAAASRISESDARRPVAAAAPARSEEAASEQVAMGPALIAARDTVATNRPAPVARAVATPVAGEAPADSAAHPAAVSVALAAPVVAQPAPSPAPAVDSTPVLAADSARAAYKDGTYTGWGTSRHGDIEASVEIKSGRIVSANISQCRTRYSCSRISELPPQVLSRQSADVDYVSGATQSSNAYYYAVVEALKKAQ